MIRGVDVASFQGQPGRWKLAAGHIDFAAVKLTELQTDGVLYVDPDAAADWAYLGQCGIARIAYLFGHPAISAAGTVALFARELIKLGYGDGDMIAIDLETADGQSPGHVAAWAAQVAELLTRTLGRVPLLYTFLSFAQAGNCAGLGHLPLWMSDPSSAAGKPRVPAPWSKWAIHQYATSGGIDRDAGNYSSAAAMTAALGKQGDDMDLTPANLAAIAKAVWTADGIVASPLGGSANPSWTAAHTLTDIDQQARATRAAVAAVAAKAGVDTAAVVAGVLQGLDPVVLADAIATNLGPDVGQQVLAALQAALTKAAQ